MTEMLISTKMVDWRLTALLTQFRSYLTFKVSWDWEVQDEDQDVGDEDHVQV